MKNALLRVAGLGALATGMIFSQTTPSGTAGQQPRQHQAGSAHGRAHFAEQIANYLNLTPDQRAQAKKIMASARQEAAPLRAQLKASHEALTSAIKSGNDAQIDQITKSEAPVMAQLAAIRAHAFEKIYATLTPEQKTKADNMKQLFMWHRGGHSTHTQSNS